MTLTFLLLSLTVLCVFKNTRAISQISKEHLNKRLVGHEIYEIRVNGRHDCIRKCFFLPMCKSTDYNGNDHMCKLNDVDSTSVDMTEFEDKPGAVFSDITEWPMAIAGACGHRPCSEEQQRCLPHKNTYRCADTEKEADCKEIKNKYPLAKDGVYTIQLWLSHQVKSVYCDMTTDGGGWTVGFV
ncbi:uncharacterized protein LOC132750260 [Ruditapes philippinarum]|uniref:uncharacterized protein LOC132750260 n=1 Tax=Ruditapes philippinarum TaxID=129788 RepID=UPI00295AE4CB|nr:uncharacterized protein LOC132750260 [Ruditapes philippinarum]